MEKINITLQQLAQLCPPAYQAFLENCEDYPEDKERCEFFIKFEITDDGEHKFTLFLQEPPVECAIFYEWVNGEWE